MRFMVITKATEASEAGVLPAAEDFDTMGNFIQELVDAGVLLDARGLQPSFHADDFGEDFTPEQREAVEKRRAKAGGKG